jgi:predicted RNA methylase
MRQVVRAALPLGEGIVLDPFMGAGSTIAAAVAVGYRSIGVEVDPTYYEIAKAAIPKLARLPLNGESWNRVNGQTQTSLPLFTKEPRTRPYSQGRGVRRKARRGNR